MLESLPFSKNRWCIFLIFLPYELVVVPKRHKTTALSKGLLFGKTITIEWQQQDKPPSEWDHFICQGSHTYPEDNNLIIMQHQAFARIQRTEFDVGQM